MVKYIAAVVLYVGVSAFSTGSLQTKEKSFFQYKGAGKVISKISNAIVSDKPGITFGFQSYANYEIANTTSFYNQPSDILHYILTTQDKRTLHFQLPILDIKQVKIFSKDNSDRLSMEVMCKDEKAIKVKEHNTKGMIVFSLRFTTYQIPLPIGADQKEMQKNWDKLLQKAAKFSS